MAKLNAVGQPRKYWGVIPTLPGSDLMALARQMEDTGFDGATALQIYGPPFAQLAVVAAGTSRLQVGTGVAVAGTRSPFETAMMAMDLDRLSSGRFVLGLGTGVQSVNTGLYGLPAYKVVAQLRDTVAAVRHIVAGSHKGLQPYEGEYYKADFKEMMVMAPPVRERVPIWVAALRDKVTQTALEIADGLMVHALWSAEYTASQADSINAAIAKYGRQRGDIEINPWPWIAVNNDQKQAIEDSRPTVAAYASIVAYNDFFAARGFQKEARLCQQAADKHSDVMSIVHHVPDEMVKAFVSCGSVEQVLEALEPYWTIADTMTVMTPYRHLSMEKMMFYGQGLFQLVAAAKH